MIKTVKKQNELGTSILACYQVTYENDNVVYSVPKDEANTDYQNILKWVEEGNTIEEDD